MADTSSDCAAENGELPSPNRGTPKADSLMAQSASVLGTRLVTRAVQAGLFLLLARALTPTEYGFYGVVTSSVFIAGVFSTLGLRQAAAFEVGGSRTTGTRVLGVLAMAWPLLGCAAAVAVALTTGLMTSGISPVTTAAVLGATSAFVLIQFAQGYFLGAGDISAFNRSEAWPRLSSFVLVLLFLPFGFSKDAALLAFSVGFILVAPLAAWRAYRASGGVQFSASSIGPMASQGFRYALTLTVIMSVSRIPLFVLHQTGDATASGHYFAAVQMSELLLEAATALGLVSFSNVVRGRQDPEAVLKVARVLPVTLWVFGSFGLLAAAAAPLITLVMGNAYRESANVLSILALGLAPAAFARVAYTAMSGTGRPLLGASAAGAGAVTTLLLALTLTKPLGAIGAAIALVTGQVVIATGYIMLINRVFSIPLADLFTFQREETTALKRRLHNILLRFKTEPDGGVPVVYYSAHTQYENVGDALINREMLRELSGRVRLRVYVGGCPADYVDLLELDSPFLVKRTYQQALFDVLRAAVFRLVYARRSRLVLLATPGDVNGALTPNTVAKCCAYFLLRRLGVEIWRIGVSFTHLTPARHAAEKFAARQTTFLGARDSGSLAFLAESGARRVCKFPDMSFLLGWNDAGLRGSRPRISFCFRDDNLETTAQERLLRDCLTAVRALQGRAHVTAAVQVSRDASFARKLSDQAQAEGLVVDVVELTSIAEAERFYDREHVVLGNRMHGLLLAASRGCAFAAVLEPGKSGKIRTLFTDNGLASLVRDAPTDLAALALALATDPSVGDLARGAFEQGRSCLLEAFDELAAVAASREHRRAA